MLRMKRILPHLAAGHFWRTEPIRQQKKNPLMMLRGQLWCAKASPFPGANPLFPEDPFPLFRRWRWSERRLIE